MKTINELTMGELEERERAAYAAGDTERADLYAAVIELRQEVEALEDVETLEHWEKHNGPADEYKEFFYDCFEHLGAHYPAPNVTSDYDKSVIFDAIGRGENLTD